MKSLVICASKRFAKEVHEFCSGLKALAEKEGKRLLLFEPNIYEATQETMDFGSARNNRVFFLGLTLEHFSFIRRADIVFIYNKDGYIGRSVTLELGFARALNKPVFSLEAKTGDPCSDCLIDFVVATPEQLYGFLH
ncbi:MAG: Uncharacterized protein G01um101418_728 [Parcubacteria group bacterium Gr01-1014_18]|nr:MAG: Uncharacterized protein Greene041636_718 [Parcubacteria group bacterium Greene0416_36]TSC80220.1 MAG: Uncharacterized protein G01um101418_728 [Parcubacteria group bacterium Gr01-1014_18]TSC98402.1 MAG: Uncharacterized protein Greene101420_755 [Parcubacteria group bacterium Greene1014_20]TSD06943.1 MAG: Uncharacterized protein Greene07142_506 [Parcubacteria group bacterium Greene0714_2]